MPNNCHNLDLATTIQDCHHLEIGWPNMMQKLKIPAEYRDKIRLFFIAKHALGDGSHDTVDGDHAVYHREVRDTLEGLGLNVTFANSPDVLFEKPDVDFVFSLLNRGGYLNSEMLVPLLCTRLGLPYLGATPILRGLSDDKHLMKMAARARGVPTAPSTIYRNGAPVEPFTDWSADRYVMHHPPAGAWPPRMIGPA
jgi:D-alanine-D-alanine ligase